MFFGKLSENGSTYYQGFNDILGLLLKNFSFAQSLIFAEGIHKNYLRDFTTIPFEQSIIPLFKSIQHIILDQKPEWEENDTLFLAIQSKFSEYDCPGIYKNSVLLLLDSYMV